MERAYLPGKHVAGLMIKGCLLNIHVNVNLKQPAVPCMEGAGWQPSPPPTIYEKQQ